MATELQFRRYTTSDLQNIIGKAGELILDSDTWELTSHDGQTPGGNKIISTVSLNLENVDNTADLDKPISTATQAALDNHTTDSTIHFTQGDIEISQNQVVDLVSDLQDLDQKIDDLDASSWEEDGVGYIKPKDSNQVKVEHIDGAVDLTTAQVVGGEKTFGTARINTLNPTGLTPSVGGGGFGGFESNFFTTGAFLTVLSDKIRARNVQIGPQEHLALQDYTGATQATVTNDGLILAGDTEDVKTRLDGKADDADVVKLTGDQTVAGEKTFTDVLTGPNIKTGVGTAGTGTLIGNLANNAANGSNSVAEGDFTTASGIYSHAEGFATTASGQASHAEGFVTNASGDSSHAEGAGTQATGNNSHAEGLNTTASGIASHAEGEGTIASGPASHAEGRSTEAQGEASHAGGISSFASGVVSSATGRRARAIHDGAKVVADNQNLNISSTTTNQHTTRFENGYRWFGGAHEAENDIEITDFEKGVILRSPNNTRWRITVNDDGNLITTQISI